MLPMYAGTCAGAPYLASIAVPIHGASFPRHRSSIARAALSGSQRVLDCYLTVHPDNFEGESSFVHQNIPIVPYCLCQIPRIHAH